MTTPAEYQAQARTAILALLDQELAVVWPEVEAKLEPEPGYGKRRGGIDPHHLETARKDLRLAGAIEEYPATTKGGRQVVVLVESGRSRRRVKTEVEAAAARKRLLQGRYLSWTRATTKRASLIGRGGEDVVHASLVAAVGSEAPYRIEERTGGDVRRLFKGTTPVPGGPLDDAAYYFSFTENGEPLLVTMLVEAKNVRHWMYPGDWEIYQLLDKAAQLQEQFPTRGFVPVLVARRIQYLTFLMARELGFYCLYFNQQPILDHSDCVDEALAEVNQELGYRIVKGTGPYPKITDGFRKLPSQMDEIAARWRRSSEVVGRFAKGLRDTALDERARSVLMNQFRQACADDLNCRGDWLGQRVLGNALEVDDYNSSFNDA